jgi:hypothetical protein
MPGTADFDALLTASRPARRGVGVVASFGFPTVISF